MILTLEITGPQAAKLGAASRKVFRESGGSIGRLPRNDWSLPDAFVSSRHALIRYRDGVFYIEDTSRNGISINAQENRLVKGTPHPLRTGDWIFIEPYEITVVVTDDAESRAASPSPFDDLFAPAAPSEPAVRPQARADPFDLEQPPSVGFHGSREPLVPTPTGDDDGQMDPLALLGFKPQSTPPPAPRAADLARSSVLSNEYRPPAAQQSPPEEAAPGLIPADWLNAERPSAVPRPGARPPGDAPSPPKARPESPPAGAARRRPAVVAPVPPREGGSDLAEVLAGAGLDGVSVSPELATDFGRILRVVVAGVIDVMDARRKIQEEFRLKGTKVQPTHNNPLKFSVNVDDALHNLLVKRNAAYLGPVEAFEDAFDDVRHHQIAMLLALRVAFNAMLAKFDPETLQEEFDQRSKGAVVAVPARLRYWEQYRQKIHDMVGDADATFRELFGDEFGSAYEEHLRRLRAQRRQP